MEESLVDDYGHKLNINDVDKTRVVFAKLYYYLGKPFLDSSFGQEGKSLLEKSLEEFVAKRDSMIDDTGKSDDRSELLGLIFEDLSNSFSLLPRSENRASMKVTRSPVMGTWSDFFSDPEAITLVESYLREVSAGLLKDNFNDLESVQLPELNPAKTDPEEISFDVQSSSLASRELTSGERDEKEVPDLFRRISDYWAYLYYYMAKNLLSLGQAGEASLREAIRDFGAHRGKELRRKVLADGQETTIRSLFENYDLPEDPRFEQELIRQDEEVRISKETSCNFSEVWGELERGLEIGKIYCEEVHHAFYSAFEPAVQVNITQTLTRGDDYCDFVLFLRKANKFKDEKRW